MAERFHLPGMRRGWRAVDDVAGPIAVSRLQVGDLADGRHGVPGHAQAAADMVSGDVVCHQSEERRQRARAATGARAGQLRDGLDLAAQAAPGDGPARTGFSHGTVEVDETYVGGLAEGKRGRGTENKAIVAVAAEKSGRGIGRIRLRRIEDVSADSLLAFVQSAVAPGSVVHTDGWNGYSGLAKAGYQHQVTIISSGSDPAHEVMPRVHIVASLLKRWLLGTHQGGVQRQHLDYYLDEFTFRFNRRRSNARGLLFHRLAQQAVAVEPAPYNLIIGRVPNTATSLRV